MKLVDESIIEASPYTISVKVYDKFFIRNRSRASLSVTVVEDGRSTHVAAIGSGGEGLYFPNSLGAETELVNDVQRIIEKMGY